ncbi:MAG: MaoC family dehydratase [Candidatus Helarchaeota archaeon]|nr:MaoC family dehydratase [Candidatus Helarchaeota archaeon]
MRSYNDVKIGEEIPSFTIKMDRTIYKQYCKLVYEINPLHFNEKYAQSLGFKSIVVAGVFTYSFFLRSLLTWVKNPTSIKNLQIRFHEPVYIEDTLTHRTKIRKKYVKDSIHYIDCHVRVENQDKELVTSGSVTLVLNS